MHLNQILVFTDLDGTLLDHDTYRFDSALSCIELLKDNHVPIIINSSKTFEEIIELRDELNINDPFIVENGAAIFFELDYFDVVPEEVVKLNNYYVLALSQPISELNKLFEKIELEIDSKIERFSTMTDQRVSELTGLSLIDSKKAKTRLYSDPIYFDGADSDLEFLVSLLKEKGYHVLVGGRFIHVTNGVDKGKALLKLIELFKINENLDYYSIALGDSNNDVAMLEIADISIVISNKNKTTLSLHKTENTFTSTLFGPAGFNEILTPIINKYL